MTPEKFSAISAEIPVNPGVYKYFDLGGTLIYVGKAKNLRKRVSSYFNKNNHSFKTRELVNKIEDIEFTIVNDEQDAFLLENALIKKFKPRYNILLKDDKTFPFIVIKNEDFPRVFFTRKKINDKSRYFGPFTSVVNVREMLDFIKQQVPLRNCTLNLSESNIKKKKFKVCLEYHLGNCLGPCEGLQTANEYEEGLLKIADILKGNLQPIILGYKNILQDKVAQLDFEGAEVIKRKLEQLQLYKSKSTIVSEHVGTVDVFSILEENDTAYVNFLSVNQGVIVITKTIELTKRLDETASEVLAFAILELRDSFKSDANEIILPFEVDLPYPNIKITVPKAGEKKQLLLLSEKNVGYFARELKQRKLLLLEKKSDQEISEVLALIQQDLHLKELPSHIECFDNSNFQGSFPVSAMVCFRNGIPSKNDYRKFNVKTVVGSNDFATMKEVVYRRYHHLLEEKNELPNLIVIDGGKGQLSAAMESIRALKMENKVTVVGLAKNEEEIFFTGDTQSIKLPWNSESLKLIRRIRDEVHRCSSY
jgi:excinuclease ABC subunit C